MQATGAQVVLNGRDAQKLAAATAQITGATKLGFDTIDHHTVRRVIDGFEAETGPIDILVNNTGMQHRGPLENFPPKAFERLLQTNIASIFHASQAVARHMVTRGAGKIIDIASVQSALARPGIAPFTATKGAMANLTEGMATDWAQYGLQCTAIAPGYFDMARSPPSRAALGQGRGIGRRLYLPVLERVKLRQ